MQKAALAGFHQSTAARKLSCKPSLSLSLSLPRPLSLSEQEREAAHPSLGYYKGRAHTLHSSLHPSFLHQVMASTSLLLLLCCFAISALLFAPLSQENHQAQATFEPQSKEISFQQTVAAPAHAPAAPAPPLNCTSACAFRCSLNGRPKLCSRACETCCYRCACVPPGTSGNHHVCGTCYNNQTTHGGKSKCP